MKTYNYWMDLVGIDRALTDTELSRLETVIENTLKAMHIGINHAFIYELKEELDA